jgi:hypothetical protein
MWSLGGSFGGSPSGLAYQDRTGIRRSPERKRKHEHVQGIGIWAGAGLAFWRVELHRPYEYRVEDEGMQSPQ